MLGIEVRGGVPQCRRAELRSSEGGREVLASDLRGVKLEDLLELAVIQVAMLLAEERHDDGVVTTLRPVTGEEEVRDALRQTRAARRQARRRVTDELLREVAQVYRYNINDNPTTAVAQHTGRAHRTAALYVQQARQAGFLGAALRAKAGEQQ